jgi:TatD DNase family protein
MADWIDTHTHLDFSDFDADREDVIARSHTAGVRRLIIIGTQLARSRQTLEWVHNRPGVFATAGIHPGNVAEHADEDLASLSLLCRNHRVAAIGECGLDYHHLPPRHDGEAEETYQQRLEAWKERQKYFFRHQLELAASLNLGVVVHQRDSWDDTLAVLLPYAGRIRAVFHCFGGTPEQVAALHQLGHWVSFTGIVTFKNARQVQDSATAAHAGRFMVETDCPYLAPVPHRGKRCEPAFVVEIGRTLARLRGVDESRLAAETTAAAEAFFRLD